MRTTRTAAATLAVTLLLTGCGSFKPKATAPEVKDCKAALRLVATDDGKIPAKPKECDPLTVTQYDAAVSDATRSKRIKATPTAP